MFPLTASLKIADTKTTYLYCSVSSCTQPSIILITGASGTLHGAAGISLASPSPGTSQSLPLPLKPAAGHTKGWACTQMPKLQGEQVCKCMSNSGWLWCLKCSAMSSLHHSDSSTNGTCVGQRFIFGLGVDREFTGPSMGQHPVASSWMPAFSSGPEDSERWKVLAMTATGNGQK